MSDITGEEFGERAKSRLKIFVEGELTAAYWIKDDVRDALIYIGELEEAVAAAKARIAELQRYVTDRDWQRARVNRLEIDVDVVKKARIAELEQVRNALQDSMAYRDSVILDWGRANDSLKAEVARLRSAWDWAKNVLADIGYNWRSIEEFDSAIDAARAQEGKG